MRKMLVLSLLVLLIGCGSAEPCAIPENMQTGTDLFDLHWGDIERFVDDEAGVVCYVFTFTASTGSIDCMPISDTRLDR